MFKPNKFQSLLTPLEILKRVSEIEIYEKILGQIVVPGLFMYNTIREEKTPSLKINYRDGSYLHIDFGNSYYRGNCFQLVQQKYNCSFNEALEIVDSMFNLGLRCNKPSDVKYENAQYKKNIYSEDKATDKIKFTYLNKWTQEASSFWEEYKLSVDYIKAKDTFLAKKIWVNDTPINFDGPAFVYYMKDIDRCKVYFPKNQRLMKGRRMRFLCDAPFDYMFFDNMINKDFKRPAIIWKSRKDELVGSLFHDKVSSVQAESYYCFTERVVDRLNSSSAHNLIGFGTDKQGKEESIKITNTFGYGYINTPNEYLESGINDIAELMKHKGEKEVEELIRRKLLL